jgi:cellulose synthase/poly-beta-1,6-N-acetylglucosamine synthase-like glycosyltransferase
MKITVLIPTYRRPQDLVRCLEGLKKQVRFPDEVIVVVRDTDTHTRTFLETFNPDNLLINIVTVTVPGQVAALNMGLESSHGNIIAITDDDAVPRPEWLARIETHFLADDQVGGVGGRDWKRTETEIITENRAVVGRVQWFGRVIGNHNMGVGEAREVDVLKGANMSYRRTAIANLRFDKRLKGTGAQVHNDLGFSLAVKRSGWKLIYDPLVEVDHYFGQRFDNDKRGEFDPVSLINNVHNETLILLEYLPPFRRLFFLFWAVLIGTRTRRGFIQCIRFLPKEYILSIRKLLTSIQGRWAGWQSWKQSEQSNSSIGTLTQQKS